MGGRGIEFNGLLVAGGGLDLVAGLMPEVATVNPALGPVGIGAGWRKRERRKTGRLRALAVTGSQRSALVPDLPTIAESGLTGYSVTAWFGLLAPAATPAEIVNRISAEVHKGFATAQMKERFSAMGADPIGSTPEQFAAFLKTEMAKWARVVKAAGIRGE